MTRTYYPTIGLEIHAELSTNTKMFCRCLNNPFDASPNALTCPTCMAHPGTLPLPNKAAIDHMVRVGLAVGGNIANFTEFDRKNYFYPDIPKGYQISQYKHPIVSGGELAGVELTRIHLEEDTATSKHSEEGSLINYNRAGVPLLELVTEPVIHDSATAVTFARELQLLLRYLGASQADIEKGEMRIEVNVSISPDKDVLGTKTEVKNIGSIAMAGKAIDYEIARMTDLWEAGRQDEIVQETRGWDSVKNATYSQRKKENSADYRYFPEPDIPKFYLHEMYNLDEVKAALPELPWQKRDRYAQDFRVKAEDIELYVTDRDLAVFFEGVVTSLGHDDKKLIAMASNYITSDLVGLMKNDDEGKGLLKNIEEEAFAELIMMVNRGDLNSRGAKDILSIIAKEGGRPAVIAEEKGLLQNNDEEALQEIINSIVEEHAGVAQDYKDGKEAALKFLIGQGMKATRGSANPQILEQLFKKTLS